MKPSLQRALMAVSVAGTLAWSTAGFQGARTPAVSAPSYTVTWFLTVSPQQNAWERHVIPIFEKTHPHIKATRPTVNNAGALPFP